ncbi:hypothetical protein [Nocardia jinanensis]|nr:hypothetical protein [Nocardia jinanensis]
MRRLSVVDEIFLRTHQGFGTPIVLQGLWRTEDVVEPAMLTRLHEALRTGPLARRVVRPRIPGARSRWQHNGRAHPLELHGTPLVPEAIPAWADTRGTHLDPEHGPGWRLSVAPLTDGGTIVALTCSHVLADARGLIIAVERALQAVDSGADANPGTGPGELPDSRNAGAHDSDWVDAARTWATVALGGARAAAARLPRPVRRHRSELAERSDSAVPELGGRSELGGRPELSGRPRPGNAEMFEPALILRCPAAEWERIATAYGGTANSLFIWFVADMLWAAGFPATVIAASLPVDTRDEPRIDNELAMTEIVVTQRDGPAGIRAKSRAAYERRMSSPGGLPEEFLYLVPDKVAHLLSRGAGERDILCSNIGPIPPALSALGPHECTGIATRALHPGLIHANRPRTRLSGYLCRFRDDYLLTLASLYPEHIADVAALHRLAAATAARVDLPIRPW